MLRIIRFSTLWLICSFSKVNLVAQDIDYADDDYPIIDYDSVLNFGFNDTSDYVDFHVDTTVQSGPNGSDDGKYCKRHHRNRAEKEVNLSPSWPYILIYEDHFDKLDRSMWLNPSTDFDTFQSFPGSDNSTNQALLLNKNINVENGKLSLQSRRETISLPWSEADNKFWPWSTLNGQPTPIKTFNYTSARAQSRWAFDGNFDLFDGKQRDNEGGIAVVSSIKYPAVRGCYPAYWMMGYVTGTYDEFDMFEFFSSNFNDMHTSMYQNGAKVGHYRCAETATDTAFRNKFIKSVYLWNRHHTSFTMNVKGFMRHYYIRHQIARDHRIGGFQNIIQENEFFRKRRVYNHDPMRINFSTTIYPDGNSGPVDPRFHARFEVDYVKVYKQIPCPAEHTILDEKSDLDIRMGVYNTITAKKAIINFQIGNMPDIPDNQMFKIIANDTVVVNQMNVSSKGTFIIKMTAKDLCKSEFEKDALFEPERENSSISFDPKSSNNKVTRISTLYDLSSMLVRNDNGDVSMIKLFDLSGRLLNTISIKNINQKFIQVHNLSSGLYIALVLDDQGLVIEKKNVLIGGDSE